MEGIEESTELRCGLLLLFYIILGAENKDIILWWDASHYTAKY